MADTRKTALRSVRPGGLTPQASIGMLAEELERIAQQYERARDPRCVFARAYANLSRVLAASIPRAGFSDPAWIAQLAAVFADYYLRALREEDAGTLVSGAWSTVFRAGSQGRTSVLEDLVLGMTAHIVNDLPRALCDVGMLSPRGESRIGDYNLLNEVLALAVEDVQYDLSRRYAPLLGVLDRMFESYDEVLTNYGLRIGRANAWYNAQRLQDPSSRAAALGAIARSPEITLREILEPPMPTLRWLFRAARVLSKAGRVWPDALPQTAAEPEALRTATR
ncbi:MAG TPA: DUF5995 family protein [Polyangiales bacterium]|nr:DUF5995 family protein [Polyangiales bacterium]